MFNLKNVECQQKFKVVTSSSTKLKMCFTQNRNFDDQCKHFFNTLDDILHQCFRKVRIGGNKIKKNEIQVLMAHKSNLKSFLISNKCKLAANMVNRKLEEVEEQLTKLRAERNLSWLLNILET